MRFTDELQLQFEQFLNALECSVLKNDTYSAKNSPLFCKFKSLLDSTQEKATSSRVLRLIQAIIDQLGSTILYSISSESKIQHVIIAILDHFESINQIFYSHQKDELFDLLKYYFDCKDILKHRNLCIVASMFAVNIADSQTRLQFYQNLNSFLVQILVESQDAQSRLFAIITLENLAVEKSTLSTLRKNARLRETLNVLLKFQCTPDIDLKLFNDDFDYFTFQVSFCACLFLEQLLHDAASNDPQKAKQLKRFSSNLSIRSDYGWNEVHMNEFLISKGIFYYEVLLLTDGQIFLGWGTLNSSSCCHGKITFIGFDGYNRVVVQNDEKMSVLETMPKLKKWKTGDVIGCLIDIGTREQDRVVFYVNGDPIEHEITKSGLPGASNLKSLVASENTPYFPSVKLSVYQQCYYNFGEIPFKYPPTDVDFQDLRSLKKPLYVPTMCLVQ